METKGPRVFFVAQMSHWDQGIMGLTKPETWCLVKLARDLTRLHPKWWFSKGNHLISGKSRLVKYYDLARYMIGQIYDGVADQGIYQEASIHRRFFAVV